MIVGRDNDWRCNTVRKEASNRSRCHGLEATELSEPAVLVVEEDAAASVVVIVVALGQQL
jgi:hypothetical protein